MTVQRRCEQQANRRSSHDRQPTTRPFSPTSTTMINDRNLKIVLPEEVQVIGEMVNCGVVTAKRDRLSWSCSCVRVIHCHPGLQCAHDLVQYIRRLLSYDVQYCMYTLFSLIQHGQESKLTRTSSRQCIVLFCSVSMH
jgi:hypothetical protein